MLTSYPPMGHVSFKLRGEPFTLLVSPMLNFETLQKVVLKDSSTRGARAGDEERPRSVRVKNEVRVLELLSQEFEGQTKKETYSGR